MRSWKHFLFLWQTKLFMNRHLSAIGSKRKRVISKKASFLVGSIILQTWNIHVSDLICQQEGVTYESYNSKHFIYNQQGKRRLFVGHQFLPTLLDKSSAWPPSLMNPQVSHLYPLPSSDFPSQCSIPKLESCPRTVVTLSHIINPWIFAFPIRADSWPMWTQAEFYRNKLRKTIYYPGPSYSVSPALSWQPSPNNRADK